MAGGFDGFDALKGRKMIIDDENGQTMSSIIRAFLLGSAYIFRHKQLAEARQQYLSAKTVRVLSRARTEHTSSPLSSVASSPTRALHDIASSPPGSPRAHTHQIVSAGSATTVDYSFTSPSSANSSWSTLRRHVVAHDWVSIRDAMHIAKHEHMSDVDSCQGDLLRRQTLGNGSAQTGKPKQTQTQVKPPALVVDNARKAELKALDDDAAIVCPLVDGRLNDTGHGDA
jgi:hypothetical protein